MLRRERSTVLLPLMTDAAAERSGLREGILNLYNLHEHWLVADGFAFLQCPMSRRGIKYVSD